MEILNVTHKIIDGTLNVLFPRKCIGCGKEGEYICEDCSVFVGEAPLICPVCDKYSYSGEKHKNCSNRYKLDGLVGLWENEGIIKNLITRIKYNYNSDGINELIEKAFKTMEADETRFESFFQFIFQDNLKACYVPMFIKKEKKKGFNQAKILADKICQIVELERIDLLKKINNTESQTKLDRKQREENIKNSFEFISKDNMPENILLVDDIYTTGATMNECCRILKQNGVKKVWGFTLARTI